MTIESEPIKPERLLPNYINEESLSYSAIGQEDNLFKAPLLEDILKEEINSRGEEVDPKINLTLRKIEEFRKAALDAISFKELIRSGLPAMEGVNAIAMYTHLKGKLDATLAYGSSFEKAYQEYERSRNKFEKFESDRQRVLELERELLMPSHSAEEGAVTPEQNSRIERKLQNSIITIDPDERDNLIDSLKSIYPVGSPEYENAITEIEQYFNGEGVLPRSKKNIEEELLEVRSSIGRSWRDGMVRRFFAIDMMDSLSKDFADGKDILETPTVIRQLNKLYEWEHQHERTTIGGVLVGPPGVGKTTLVRHYLEQTGRPNYVYIDLSEDVTRYMLFGTKSIEFNNASTSNKQLIEDLSEMNDKDMAAFVRENPEILEAIGHNDEEGEVDFSKKVLNFAKRSHRKELGSEFLHLDKKNGWRDGVIISALRRGESIICDEFTKNKNWSLIFGLLTAKPGEAWYFADNDEWIDIPKDWRMYFTANIGRKHGGFEVPEALASRMGGKVMEVTHPPAREVMDVALVSLSDRNGNFLRSESDLSKLFVTVMDLFPKIQKDIVDKRQTIPVSYRTLRDLSEKLIVHDPVYVATKTTFDEALYDVLIRSYDVYEDKTTPKEIVKTATSMGLMLDDSISNEVKGWLGENEYDDVKNKFEDDKAVKSFKDIISGLKANISHVATSAVPHEPKRFK